MAKDIVQGIEGAFDRNLASVKWMDDAARVASKEKLQKINNKIGYPDKWRDYSTMNITRESLLANVDRVGALREQARPGQDRQAGGPQRVGHDARRPSTPTTTRR